MVVDAARMRRNLDLTARPDRGGGGDDGPRPACSAAARRITSCKHACDVGADRGVPLADALAREPAVTARLDRAAIERLIDPRQYLGSAGAFIDRVVAAAERALPPS